MTRQEYVDFCNRQGQDETWNAANNPERYPPDPYTQGDPFATVNGA